MDKSCHRHHINTIYTFCRSCIIQGPRPLSIAFCQYVLYLTVVCVHSLSTQGHEMSIVDTLTSIFTRALVVNVPTTLHQSVVYISAANYYIIHPKESCTHTILWDNIFISSKFICNQLEHDLNGNTPVHCYLITWTCDHWSTYIDV